MKCMLCEEHKEIIEVEKRKVIYEGKEIEYEHEFCYCYIYNEKFETPILMDKNLKTIRNSNKKIVTMPIHKKWFGMISVGKKREEYREIKEYWRRRLLHDKTTHLKLINGYGQHRPYIIVELKNIRIGTGKKEWGAVPGEQYYVLELGKIVERGNL